MAKILLINPVIREEDVPKHIPYGLSLLASIAMNEGHLVQMYDANAWRKGWEVFEQVVGADNWDVVAFGGLSTTYNSNKRAAQTIRKLQPNTFIMAGGGFLTSMPKEIMSWLPEVDLGIVGEAFVTWPVVLKMLDEGQRDFSNTNGVCYRDKNGQAKLTPVRPNINNLDVLPYPAWDLLPLEEVYFPLGSSLYYSDEAYTAKRRMDINGSFGCGLICKFCWHLGTTGEMIIEPDKNGENDVRFTYGRNIRWHSPEYIVNMVKHLVQNYQIDFASFIDENMMTMNSASQNTWLPELCELWIKEGLQPECRKRGVPHDENCRSGVHWSGTSHATLAKKDILDQMYKAGCSHLVYGIESFDPSILKNLGKGTTQKSNLLAVQTCLDSGINPIPNIILGFPEENFDSIRTTMEGMVQLGIRAKPHFATPYPGSEWYYTYKSSIISQYGGNLEKFIMDLGDASSPTVSISKHFSAMELLGLQIIMANRDFRLLELAKQHYLKSRREDTVFAEPEESFNIIKKKVRAPMEEAASQV